MSPGSKLIEQIQHVLRRQGAQPQKLGIDGLSTDFYFPKQRWAIEVKHRLRSMDVLLGSWLHFASYLKSDSNLRVLWIVLPYPVTPERIDREWKAAKRVLDQAVAKRMHILAIFPNTIRPAGHDPFTSSLLTRFSRAITQYQASARQSPSRFTASLTKKSAEILKLLLIRWLLSQPPITPLGKGDLKDQAGCSYPVLQKALGWLSPYLQSQGHAVALRAFPTEPWQELVASQRTYRRAIAFADATKENDPNKLLARLIRMNDSRLAVSGVVAARHWDHSFNLNGLPRLDVVVHDDQGRPDLSWIDKLDPALAEVEESFSPKDFILKVHHLQRPITHFVKHSKYGLIADPVEVLLDLYDLKLTQQADAMIQRLRNREPKH